MNSKSTEAHFLGEFFGDAPAVVCSTDGNMVIFNACAKNMLRPSLLESDIHLLLDDMDKLRFDIVMQSKEPRQFSAAANKICGYKFIRIFSGYIGERKMCVASFVNSENEVIRGYSERAFLERFISEISDSEAFIERRAPREEPFFDILGITQLLVTDISAIKKYKLRFSGDVTGICPCSVSMGDYISLVSVAVSAMNDMSGEKIVDISLERNSTGYRLKIAVSRSDGETGIPHACRSKFSLCSFIAEGCGCNLSMDITEKEIGVYISVEENTTHADFKSCGVLDGYADMLECAVCLLDAISKAIAQA